jgi:hypothetical protein
MFSSLVVLLRSSQAHDACSWISKSIAYDKERKIDLAGKNFDDFSICHYFIHCTQICIYLIVCFSVIFLLERYLKTSSPEEEVNKGQLW